VHPLSVAHAHFIGTAGGEGEHGDEGKVLHAEVPVQGDAHLSESPNGGQLRAGAHGSRSE